MKHYPFKKTAYVGNKPDVAPFHTYLVFKVGQTFTAALQLDPKKVAKYEIEDLVLCANGPQLLMQFNIEFNPQVPGRYPLGNVEAFIITGGLAPSANEYVAQCTFKPVPIRSHGFAGRFM